MRGAEKIWELPKGEENWEGDPVGAPEPEREIRDCQLIPRTHPDDQTLIVDGWQIFVPPGQTPPQPTSRIRARDPGDATKTVEWEIDGNVAVYDMKSKPKGALFIVKRVI